VNAVTLFEAVKHRAWVTGIFRRSSLFCQLH